MELIATKPLRRPAVPANIDIHSLRRLKWLAPVIALALSACDNKPPQQAAPAAPPVTVAQPVKRTVTDWDEFTGRFEAVQEVQVRARVGGFVTSVEFRDGSVVAQLGPPDMRVPFAHCLAWPDRIDGPAPRLDLAR